MLMTATVDQRGRGAMRHVWAWVQAAALVYAIGLGMVLLGATVALAVRALIELVSWIAGLMQ